jgi:hypothetical protein
VVKLEEFDNGKGISTKISGRSAYEAWQARWLKKSEAVASRSKKEQWNGVAERVPRPVRRKEQSPGDRGSPGGDNADGTMYI